MLSLSDPKGRKDMHTDFIGYIGWFKLTGTLNKVHNTLTTIIMYSEQSKFPSHMQNPYHIEYLC